MMKPINAPLILVLFSLFDFILCSSLYVHHANTSPKVWISTCRIFYCDYGLNMCVRNGCLGRSNCQDCVREFFSSCEMCAQDIFDEAQDFLNTGSLTLFCDPSDKLHQVVCSFFCRSNFKLYSECKLINQKPVCECLNEEPSLAQSITTGLLSTTMISTAFPPSTGIDTNGNTFVITTPTSATSSSTSSTSTTRPLATTSTYKPLIDNPYGNLFESCIYCFNSI